VRETMKKSVSNKSAAVKRRLYVYLECVIQRDCCSSCGINPLPGSG
jgi:hypothetical protein